MAELDPNRWSQVRRVVLERDGHRCVQCRATEKLDVDHIWPRLLGGTNHPYNLQVLCRSCNDSKGPRLDGRLPLYCDRDPWEALDEYHRVRAQQIAKGCARAAARYSLEAFRRRVKVALDLGVAIRQLTHHDWGSPDSSMIQRLEDIGVLTSEQAQEAYAA